MPQFSRQSSRSLNAEHFRRAARRIREFADRIEAQSEANDPINKRDRTLAIHGLSRYVSDLAKRNRATL